jgi:hypothetical protein
MPENGELRFSLYELRKVLRWADDSGKAYKQMRDSLLRIATTSVQSKQAFYSAHEKRRITDTFTVWSVHFAEHEMDGAPVRERHVLRFHPIFIRNYIAQYLKGLDADFYWSLHSPLSKRLYRLIDLQRAGGISWKTNLFTVRDQVPLHYSYPSQIKRALQKTHEELENRGFLSGIEYEGKMGILYRVSREFARRQKARELSGDPQEIFAIERLIQEGLHGDVARDLVVRYGFERCLRYADALDSQRGIRSRTGWLRKAIEEGYELPHTPEAPPLSLFAGSDNDQNSPSDDPQHVSDTVKTQLLPPPVADPRAQAVWEPLLEELSRKINAPSLHVWFEGTVPTAFEDTTLVVRVPNQFALEYLESRFGELMRSVLKEQVGPDAKLLVQAPDGASFADYAPSSEAST